MLQIPMQLGPLKQKTLSGRLLRVGCYILVGVAPIIAAVHMHKLDLTMGAIGTVYVVGTVVSAYLDSSNANVTPPNMSTFVTTGSLPASDTGGGTND